MKPCAQTALLLASQTSIPDVAVLTQLSCFNIICLHGASYHYSMPFVVSVKRPLTHVFVSIFIVLKLQVNWWTHSIDDLNAQKHCLYVDVALLLKINCMHGNVTNAQQDPFLKAISPN